MTDPELEFTQNAMETHENEESDEGDDYDEEDADLDAEAAEIARRLGAELWADISKAKAACADEIPAVPSVPIAASNVPEAPYASTNPPYSNPSPRIEAAIQTMKNILSILEKDTLARSAFARTMMNGSDECLLDVIGGIAASGTIPQGWAVHLSQILIPLASSEALFDKLFSDSSSQLDNGKRKREEVEIDPRLSKRPYLHTYDLGTQVNHAVRVISQALGHSQSLDPPVISSIQLELHQVFLFAVTSSAGGGPEMYALQEIGGLIQVIGVLSGIQIGQTTTTHQQWLPSAAAQEPPLITDIGTAVYPCLIEGCRKTFSRLYSLRAHQRVHNMHRPFRCHACPASFARNHDLKRHQKLHDKTAWKCTGCNKIFSRRDALKRHKNSPKTRAKGEACIDADVVEVEVDDEGGDEEAVKEERRAKLWNGTTVKFGGYEDVNLEDGEIPSPVIFGIQAAVMSLHRLFQVHVANTLGTPSGPESAPPADPKAGQETLASVIARVQHSNQSPRAGYNEHSPSPSIAPGLSGAAEPPSQQEAPAAPTAPPPTTGDHAISSLSMYGLSDEQTKMLEEAIANAASAAQAQAEAEAALEEEEYDEDDEDMEGSDGHPQTPSVN